MYVAHEVGVKPLDLLIKVLRQCDSFLVDMIIYQSPHR